MNVVPKAGPTTLTPPTSNNSDTRTRAISKFNELSQVQETPVQNPSRIAPEEMLALDTTRQKDTVEAPESTEPVVEETKPVNPADEMLSRQYAQLARKEKALRAQAQAFKAEQDAFKAQQAALESKPKAPAFDESKYVSKDRLNQDTMNALAEAGLSYEQITQLMLNPPQAQDPATKAHILKLEAKLAALEEGQNQAKQSFEEQQTQQYQQAVAHMKNEAKQLIYTDPAYETVKATNSVNDVVELIERTFKEDGVLMTVEEAAQQVEDYLIDEAVKLASLKKVQAKMKPTGQQTSQQAPQSQQKQQQTQTMKTLTNSVGNSRQLSVRERAIAAFKGEKI